MVMNDFDWSSGLSFCCIVSLFDCFGDYEREFSVRIIVIRYFEFNFFK